MNAIEHDHPDETRTRSAPARVAIIASHVIQYQAPLFRCAAADPGMDVMVFYCSRKGARAFDDEEMKTRVQWDIPLIEGYDHQFLRNFGVGRRWLRLVNPGVITIAAGGRFEAIVLMIGWGTVTSLLTIAAARVFGRRVFLFGDSSAIPPETGWAGRLRARLLAAIIRAADGYLISGSRNALYYRHYGADPANFFDMPYAVDNARFTSASLLSPDQRQRRRSAMSLRDEDFVVIYSGKLAPHKDPETLVRAVAAMAHRATTAIVFAGHGVMAESLQQLAARSGVRAYFAGFVNQSELPELYGASDVLVLPSLADAWGLVVNEAMASGLPVVVSDRCGVAGDLVRPGENGFVFPAGSADALAASLDQLASEAGLRARMGERSRAIVADWSYTRAVAGLHDAVSRSART